MQVERLMYLVQERFGGSVDQKKLVAKLNQKCRWGVFQLFILAITLPLLSETNAEATSGGI